MAGIITLTTDFGTRDAYVAAMKGVMLGIAPDVRFVDISNQVSPQDVMEAAFVLRGALPYFPAGTIHLVVVDPGVGTSRRGVALRRGDQLFVGPDNGLFPLVLDEEPPDELVELDRPAFWRSPSISATFHGRDVFAPAAAHLAAGRSLEEIGTPIDRLRPLHWALPKIDDEGITGWVVHVDRFGNCVTNVQESVLDEARSGRTLKCFVGDTIIEGAHATYGEVEAGEPLLLVNSSGYLEVAVNGGNAAELLGIRKGATVNVLFRDAGP